MSSAREQQVEALYRAALDRPPSERASFVAALSAGDEQVRQAVEHLLSRQDATDVGASKVNEPDAAAELRAGTEVGQYVIESVLGRGGMGIVYRATDRKLNRPVAIKFLSSALADAAARHRFQKEAETTSALNHPHIVTVYDVGEHDGEPYIVSELVDGGTLDDWSAAARHSWRRSVELMTGVADGLAAAHSAGVLHRDVKPGNILIGSKGYAKIADFGLAKLVNATGDGARPPARTTRAGVVVGTVAYMSPEQATGQALDARSDIFSFGVVLYELVAGRRPFAGANDLEVLKAIAHGTPAPLPEETPELLRLTLDKALEKEPGDRYQTMQDLVADLKRVTRKSASSQVPVAARRPPAASRLIAAGLGVALAAALVPATLYFLRQAPAPATPLQLAFKAPGAVANGLAVSPDGRQIAYAAVVNGVRQIWLRPIDAREARVIDGTQDATALFWSPDSRQIAFLAAGSLKRVDVASGTVQSIATGTAPLPLPGSWSPDGTILYSAGIFVSRVPATGGTATRLAETPVLSGGGAQERPLALPDGEHFLFVATQLTNQTDVVMTGSFTTPDTKPLLTVPRPVGPERVPGLAYSNGVLLFIRDNTLVAQPFDTERLAVSGDAAPIAANVAEFSVSPTVLVYREMSIAGAQVPRRLIWRDRNGQRIGEVVVTGPYVQPALSPDGRRVAVSINAANEPFLEDIYSIDLERGSAATRITFHEARDSFAAWSADGTRLAFNSGRDGVYAIPSALYERAANGAGTERLLFSAGEPEHVVLPWDWSGNYLLFGRAAAAEFTRHLDIWALETSDQARAFPVIESAFRKGPARLSPDGRWIAYGSNESSGNQIFVQPFPDVGQGKWQVTAAAGGHDPRWRADGRELFYLSPAGEVMAVEIPAGETFEPGPPRTLFATGMTIAGGEVIPNSYYMTTDGERFLINEPAAATAAASDETSSSSAATTEPEIHVIVNWSARLPQP